MKNHPNYHTADYQYLQQKGYTDKEILKIWDQDKSQGKGPQKHTHKPWKK